MMSFCFFSSLFLVLLLVHGHQAAKIEEVSQLHKCVLDKTGPRSFDIRRYSNAILECLNGDRDNSVCCREKGVAGTCMRQCNGTVPQNLEVDELKH
uniref:Domain of unknown function DB domain-containing protein n=1 Tax=Ditylenchus dipsaci TaxID=166011 RepID=A0A915CX33_9BILA